MTQAIERRPAALADPDEGLSAESQQSDRLDRLAELSARIRPYSTDALTIALSCLGAATALRFMGSWTNSDLLFATYFPAITWRKSKPPPSLVALAGKSGDDRFLTGNGSAALARECTDMVHAEAEG